MNFPKVTVVIPTFNRAPMLRIAIDSCLNQTYLNLECIVVDDGSTDATSALCENYGNQIRYFRIQNSGAPVARNLGLEAAEGDYVKFLDSDDHLISDAIEKQVLRYVSEPLVGSDIVTGYHHLVSENGLIKAVRKPLKQVLSSGKFSLADVLRRNPPTSCPLYRKSQLKFVSGFNPHLPILQDYDIAFKIAFSGFTYKYYSDHIYNMVDHNNDVRVSNGAVSGRLDAQLSLVKDQANQCGVRKDLSDMFYKGDVGFAFGDRLAGILLREARALNYEGCAKVLALRRQLFIPASQKFRAAYSFYLLRKLFFRSGRHK